ncbi:hypothetical protein JRQ81_010786 [Phrynocephalus forsythii]|uniref:Uncharacterized protein n=1 Tax=Phrynocephalus forsythii TaxID=171643 RepID=A0A9Q0X833_9SAUR|nr:hypothetical protein JRQ81_010786 [Phrynocephalus forsythii]
MIVTTWTAFVVFRRATRSPLPSGKASDDDTVDETEIVSVLEHWLTKIEEESAKIFRQRSENRADTQVVTKLALRAIPSVSQDLAAARSKPEPWEKFEDRRPSKVASRLSNMQLASFSSNDLLSDRMMIQFNRWSQTRVYRVTSDMRRDAMQERLDKVRNSISRVMFEAITDADSSQSSTSLHTSKSTF